MRNLVLLLLLANLCVGLWVYSEERRAAQKQEPALELNDKKLMLLSELGPDQISRRSLSEPGVAEESPELGLSALPRQSGAFWNSVQKQAGVKIPQNQKDLFANSLKNNSYSKLSKDNAAAHRKGFNKNKNRLIRQWEAETGQQWPRYKADVVFGNGVVTRRAGQPYDAYRLIDSSHGGPNEWWNIYPVRFLDEGCNASKLPKDYVEFLRKVGFGEIGDGWFMLYSGVVGAKDIFSESAPELKNLLFIGDDMQGINVAIDVCNESSIVEVDSSDMSVLKVAASFTEYMESLIKQAE